MSPMTGRQEYQANPAAASVGQKWVDEFLGQDLGCGKRFVRMQELVRLKLWGST